MKIKTIIHMLFLITPIILLTYKSMSPRTFYIKNKSSDYYVQLEISYKNGFVDELFLEPNGEIGIYLETFMPIFGPRRGSIIEEDLNYIKIYECFHFSIGYGRDKLIIKPEKLIITIDNNKKDHIIEYHSNYNYQKIPISISYSEQ